MGYLRMVKQRIKIKLLHLSISKQKIIICITFLNSNLTDVTRLIDSRCQSFTAQWCITPSLREALLDARRDTVTHRATNSAPTNNFGKRKKRAVAILNSLQVH